MNYEELSLEERIDKAAEYAVLLSADTEPDEAFLDELGSMFNLTRDQARVAYDRMLVKHAAAYNKIINEKIRTAGQIFLVTALMGVIYYFMASELAEGMYVFVLLFGFTAVGWLFMVVRWSAEKAKPAEQLFPKQKDGPDFRRMRRLGITCITGGVGMLMLYYFIAGKNLTEKDLQEVKGLVLTSAEQKKGYVGKGKRIALDFIFSVQGTDQHLNFRVFPDDDPDGSKYVNSWDFSTGTSMDVMMDKKDAQDFENKNSEGPFTVYNVKLRGIWLVSLEQTALEDRKKFRSFTISICILIAVGLILVIYSRLLQSRQ